jgi:hypothetical protein
LPHGEPALAAELEDDPQIEIVDDLEPCEFEEVVCPSPSAVDGGSFAALFRALVQVAERIGCRSAEPRLTALFDAQAAAEVPEDLRTEACAWRALLQGECHELPASNSCLLDEWGAKVLAHLAGAVGKTEQIRLELRARGVAAFGLVRAD